MGNSLTEGTLGPISDGFRSFVVLTRQADYLVQPLGWHIKCDSSLVSIAMNPDETCVDPAAEGDRFAEALPAASWDFLVVQPHPGSGSTLATDVEVIGEMAALVSENTTVLVFTGWPKRDGFAESWISAGEIGPNTPTEHSRIYFDTLVARLRDVLVQDVQLIPSAEVLYRTQPYLALGNVPGLAGLADLYSDDVHLNVLGNWLSGVTAAAVMTGTDPESFGKPPAPYYGDNADFSKEYIQLVRAAVADVLAE